MEQKNSILSNKIKENSIFSLQNLTIHGIPNLFREKPLSIKIIWLLLTIISACLSVYFINKSVYHYLEYEVTTEVRLIDAKDLEMPNIMICNKNQLSSDISINYLDTIAKHLGFKDYQNNKEKIKQFLAILPPGYIFHNISFELGQNLTNKPKEIIFECVFNHRKCDESWFEWIFNINYGNCYRLNTFNLKDNIGKSTKANSAYGLYLKLYLGQLNELDYLMPDKMIYLSLHDHKSNPFDELDLIELPGGFETTIQIHVSKFSKYPDPYSNCQFDDSNDDNSNTKYIRQTKEFYQKTVGSNYSYSQSICIEMCKSYYVRKQNMCLMAKSSLNSIDNNQVRECVFNFDSPIKFAEQFLKEVKIASELVNKCENECPLECVQVKYDTKILLKQYPLVEVELAKEQIIQKGLLKNESRIEKDLISFTVYFGSMSYLNYKENPLITLDDLVADIGGNLGLFLGMSLLSVTEFLDIILSWIFIYYEVRFKNKSISQSQNG